MTPLLITAVLLITGGVVASVANVLKYSDFVARLQRVNRALAAQLAMDLGENWSSKNAVMCKFFWNREYLAIADTEVQRLGAFVRSSAIATIVLFIAGLLLLSVHGILVK